MINIYGIKLKELLWMFKYPIVILFLQGVLLWFGAYVRFPWIDIPMHFFGGLSVGFSFMLLLAMLQTVGTVGGMKRSVGLVIVVCAVAFTAVMWELFEFAFGSSATGIIVQGDAADTDADLALGILGGAVGGWIRLGRIKRLD